MTTYFGATAVRVINAKFWKQNNMNFNTIGKHLGILIYLTWILPIPPSFSDFHFLHCPALLVRRLMSLQLITSLQASIFNIHPERCTWGRIINSQNLLPKDCLLTWKHATSSLYIINYKSGLQNWLTAHFLFSV